MRIRQLREMYGIQQKELASVIGISPNTLSQYETEKREPGLEIISKLADYFNVTVDFIYGLSDFTRCKKCGLEFYPLIQTDIDIHNELHNRWEKSVKKHGKLYVLYSENEKIKNRNRTIVKSLDIYSLEERYHAQLEVFRCLFSRSLSATNYNENHIDFATYVSMLLNQQHFQEYLDTELYNKFVDEYGTTEGIPYGTYYEPSIQPLSPADTLTAEDNELLYKYKQLDSQGKKIVDFTLQNELERVQEMKHYRSYEDVIEIYELLNRTGKIKALDYMNELGGNSQYNKNITSDADIDNAEKLLTAVFSSENQPKAAHNDHMAEPGEYEKVQKDLSILKKPD